MATAAPEAPGGPVRSRAAALVAACCCTLLALAVTYPLVWHLGTDIPGEGPGDNVAALWNFWWARYARAHALDIFQTPHLFAPGGTSLALHTHLALPAWVGAYLLPGVPLILAHNLLLLATLTLNGLATFWLARRLRASVGAALVAAAVFAASPYMTAHLHGHFNALSAWTLPLVAMLAMAVAAGSMAAACGLGAVLGATVYLDYYYAIYATALVIVLMVCERWTMRLAPAWVGRDGVTAADERRRQSTTERAVAGLTIVLLAAIALIALTDGFDVEAGPLRLSAHESFNLRQVLWALIAWLVWRRWPLRFSMTLRHPRCEAGSRRARGLPVALLVAAVIAVLVAAPAGVALGRLVLAGDYVAPAAGWRSGASGVDLATLFTGPPFGVGSGGWTRAGLAHLRIDPIERVAWTGLVPLVLVAIAIRAARSRAADAGMRARGEAVAAAVPSTLTSSVTTWAIVAVLALVWALGPHLTVLGQNTGMILPEALLRYIPGLSNARIPGRAMVVVSLAIAVLAAFGWDELRRAGARWPAFAALMLALAIDLLPAPFPLTRLDAPAIYQQMAGVPGASRESAVAGEPARAALLELPVGVRDGFGETGHLDHRVLWYQSLHERPLVGGFVARMSSSTRQAIAGNPLLADLLALSAGGMPSTVPPLNEADARRWLAHAGVGAVMLDRSTASEALRRYVDEVLPLRERASDEYRTLYEVDVTAR